MWAVVELSPISYVLGGGDDGDDYDAAADDDGGDDDNSEGSGGGDDDLHLLQDGAAVYSAMAASMLGESTYMVHALSSVCESDWPIMV
ncbi:hypothetical protein Tco_1280650 [Tanacetum coccineum]